MKRLEDAGLHDCPPKKSGLKVLFVSGYETNVAEYFEELIPEEDYAKYWEKAKERFGSTLSIELVIEEDFTVYVDLQAFQFGEVDRDFIEFIQKEINIHNKHNANFYVID